MTARRFDIANLGWRAVMSIATVAMLLQQAFSYVCQMTLPILADRIAEDFGVSRAWLGLYLFIQNMVAIVAAVGCGGFILRYGPMRVSQGALTLMAGSLFVIASGWMWLYPISALLLGVSAVSTPASSHILARVCPPRLAPLVFSIKQTGVPVGSLIGGLLIPFLLGLVFYTASFGTTVRLGPFGAALVVGLIVLGVALALQPIRAHFDSERRPDTRLSMADLPATMRLVLDNYPLRDIAFAAFAFGGLQSIFAGFFILFLIDGLHYSELEAGTTFAIASFTAVWARIAWGWLGSGLVPPRWILSGIGLVGAGAAVSMALIDVTWTLWQITAVAVVYNISALSWHGILLSETARLSPPDNVGGVTGGVLSFTSVAMMVYPAFYGTILAVTGSYKTGFVIGSVPALIAFFVFAAPTIEGPWIARVERVGRDCLRPRSIAIGLALTALGVALGLYATSP